MVNMPLRLCLHSANGVYNFKRFYSKLKFINHLLLLILDYLPPVCTDMDECKHDGMCPNGVCVNVDGSYICRCNTGFRQSPNQQICIGVSV